MAGAVAVVITHGNEILLTRRNQEPKKGKLDLPGGFVDPSETAETTCRRELEEELSIVVEESKLHYLCSLPNVYSYKQIDYNTLDLFYTYEVDSKFEAQLELAEISESVWMKPEDIELKEVAFDSQRTFLQKYIDKTI